MSDKEILAFYSPYTGAGKSTAAENITGLYYPLTLSFAAPLYRFAEYINFNFVNVSTYGKNDPCDEFGGKSLREFLIYFGQSGREFYQNIWSEVMRKNIYKLKDTFNIIIDDLRFPNEYAMLREEGAKIVRITNPGREIIESGTEAKLEGYKFDYELVNYKRSIEEYQAQLDEMIKKLWP
ncbi:MAG: hypothetical protein IJG62_07275 [Synergistaceae bacterium]|nr:hypothetical protein [Synergistaceae bacterium]MBQ9895789.1 hypothetical protein [Synergistaceae bacterium]MBR0097792.1 hypothetical protein [Synergistaceae bacterium]